MVTFVLVQIRYYLINYLILVSESKRVYSVFTILLERHGHKMKKNFLKTICFCVIVTLLTGCQLKIKECNVTPVNLLIFGDSISTGYGLEDYNYENISQADYINTTNSYGYIIAQKYNLTDTYNNFAHDGDNSLDLLNKLKTQKYDDYIRNADYIVVSIGGNDLIDYFYTVIEKSLNIQGELNLESLKQINFKDIKTYENVIKYLATTDFSKMKKTTIDTFISNFSDIVEYLYNMNPNANLLFQTVFNPFSGLDNYILFDKIAQSFLMDMNNIIKDKKFHSYDYIDVYSIFENRAETYTNMKNLDIHPNLEGHKQIAILLDDKITKST